jgi:hypothetical protein
MNIAKGDTMADLEFIFNYKDYCLRACPERLVRFSDTEKNETIDFMKSYIREEDGRELWYSIGYFTRGTDGYSFQFVGSRPFEDIDLEDLPILWTALKSAQEILDNFFELTNN